MIEQVKAYRGSLVKDYRGWRYIFRIAASDGTGQSIELFLKRNWKPRKKDGLASLMPLWTRPVPVAPGMG